MKRRAPINHWMDAGLRRRHNPFSNVSVSTLRNYQREIGALIAASDSEKARLSIVQSLVSEALEDRDGPDEVVIADHAIVRWLERYEGFDTSRVERAIAEMLETGAQEVAVRDGIVITVLPPGCAAINTPA